MLVEESLSWRKRWGGLARRSSGELRSLVQSHFLLAARDFGLLMTLLLLLITGVRTLPLLTELWHHFRRLRNPPQTAAASTTGTAEVHVGSSISGSTSSGSSTVSITDPGARRIVLKHIKGAGRDLRRLCSFLFFSTLVLMMGVGVPSFLTKLPSRMRSLEDATSCAREHVDQTLRYLCELLLLFTAWRSYKLLVTGCLYAALVPPACIAEAIPRALSSVQVRFLLGVGVWLGLLVGAFVLTMDTGTDSSSQTQVRTGFLALFGGMIGVVAVSTLSLQKRSIFRNPIVDSCTGTSTDVIYYCCYFGC
jgi:hypothetical protein